MQDLFAPETAPDKSDDKSDDPSTKQLAPFESFREQFDKLKTTAETLTVVSADDAAGMKLARLTRLSLKDVRVAIEHRRKELGEFHLRETQRINRDAKTLREIIEPLEARMLECEQFAEREAARILAEKTEARTAEITPFLIAGAVMANLGGIADTEYAALLADAKASHAARLAREAKEKADAEAKAKAEEAARIQMREENARLKREADEREAQAKAEAKKAADALAKVKADADAKAKAAKAKADAEAQKLREEAAAAAAELKRIADAKAKAEADRLAAEEAAAAAPDKAKFAAFASTLRTLALPDTKTKKGDATRKELGEKIEGLAAWIESRI